MTTNGAPHDPHTVPTRIPESASRLGLPPARTTRPRHRGGLLMASIGALVMLLLIGLVAVVLGLGKNPDSGAAPAGPAVTDPGWDLAAETSLATRPMQQLPEAAALPHTLSTRTPAGLITLPPAGGRNGVLADQFPPTPEGALAQLAELTRVGLQGADPQTYELAYASIAASGAPEADSTGMHRALVDARRAGQLPMQGALTTLSMTFAPMAGLIKGTTDRGRYAVVCVIGEVDVTANGTPITSTGGDCQALRWSGQTWQIAPGAAAAAGPIAWPGSDEAFDAGYLPFRTS